MFSVTSGIPYFVQLGQGKAWLQVLLGILYSLKPLVRGLVIVWRVAPYFLTVFLVGNRGVATGTVEVEVRVQPLLLPPTYSPRKTKCHRA